MIRRFVLVLAAVAFAAFSGCANGRFYNPFRPGDVQTQRIRATVHDPYPDQDKGHAVDDARPRDYQKQSPEPVRNRFFTDSWWGASQ